MTDLLNQIFNPLLAYYGGIAAYYLISRESSKLSVSSPASGSDVTSRARRGSDSEGGGSVSLSEPQLIMPTELSDDSPPKDIELAKDRLIPIALTAYGLYRKLYIDSYGDSYRGPNEHKEILNKLADVLEPFN